jgi:hypothetical protein
MTAYSAGYAFGQLIVFLAFLVPAIFFLRAQQKALAVVHPENRKMQPGLVWLQLIPFFNYVWIFVVVKRIADSFAKQYAALQSDSILGIPDEEALKVIGKRPTLGIGLAYCILLCCFPLFTIAGAFSVPPRTTRNEYVYVIFGFIMISLSLGVITCWIIYWVQLAHYKNKLKRSLA